MEGRDYIHDALQGRCHGLGVEGARMVKDQENEVAGTKISKRANSHFATHSYLATSNHQSMSRRAVRLS